MLNNKKGFTLAELMVIMAVMTILLAAVAPIFTSRYKKSSVNKVWETVSNDGYNDIYFDAPSKYMLSQAFIGITPSSGDDVKGTNFYPYSKLLIRSVSNLSGKPQPQIDLFYGNNRVGRIFAGNNSLIAGGNYSDDFKLTNSAANNTAFGVAALNDATTGQYNTAIGYQSGYKITSTAHDNTVISMVKQNSVPGSKNTIIGKLNYSGQNNTLAGNSINASGASYSTAVGNNISLENSIGSTAIGYGAYAKGIYNTAVGSYALDSANSFSYNTGIGYKSCSNLGRNAKYKTCIGGVGKTNSMSNTAKSFYDDDVPRVFIGSGVESYAAAVEVHNAPGTTSNSKPVENTGNASVVINGNLIVRGQPFLTGFSPDNYKNIAHFLEYGDFKNNDGYSWNPGFSGEPALMGVTLSDYNGGSKNDHLQGIFVGDDGFIPTARVPNMVTGLVRSVYNAHESCLCTYSCHTEYENALLNSTSGYSSYDWSSKYGNRLYPPTGIANEKLYTYHNSTSMCGYSLNSDGSPVNTKTPYYIFDRAHAIYGKNSASCCPILTNDGDSSYITSDKRLKNISSPFEGNLDDLYKLSFYNFAFKKDENRINHVGVIAQDLKRVFRNSVFKNDKGYYKIKTDEMFYSAINAVKYLHDRIQNLYARVESQYLRVKQLKESNERLYKELEELTAEINNLENK